MCERAFYTRSSKNLQSVYDWQKYFFTISEKGTSYQGVPNGTNTHLMFNKSSL